jgi:hypothetical protein
MMRTMLRAAAALLLLVAAPAAWADCWRAPSGEIFHTQAGSTPPVRGAVRVACPPQCPMNFTFDGRGCRCVSGFTARGSACVPVQPPGDPCQPYYNKGYCVDYIQSRIGTRPRGNPAQWPTRRDMSLVREGSAVVFAGVAAPYGHVAYIDRVNRDGAGRPMSIDISEMNYGRGLRAGTPASCAVTSNFGVVTRRRLSVNDGSITGYWSSR